MKNGSLMRLCPEVSNLVPPLPAGSDDRRSSVAEDNCSIEKSLLRWINSNVDDSAFELSDFKQGLQDGKVYFSLLKGLFPSQVVISKEEFASISGSAERADVIVELGRTILGSQCVLEADDIVKNNETMNILFLATLCRKIARDYSDDCKGQSVLPHAPVGTTEHSTIAELESKLHELMRENENLKATLDKRPSTDANLNQDEKGFVEEKVDCETHPKSCKAEETSSEESFTETDPKDSAGVSSVNISSDSDGFSESDGDETIPMAPIGACSPEDKRDSTRNDPGRLRLIYHYTAKLKPLLRVIYWDISTTHLLASCTHSGWIRKKSVWGSRWNQRFAIIKDHFILFYEGLKVQIVMKVDHVYRVENRPVWRKWMMQLFSGELRFLIIDQ